MKTDFPIFGVEKLYLTLGTLATGILTYYTDLQLAVLTFGVLTTLDTLTAIHANARSKGLKMNIFKKYFWKEITSSGLRNWTRKVFAEYGVYLIIAFVLDQWVLKHMVVLNVFERELTLPVAAIYLFSFIEMWSIGENIERAGGINIFKKILHLLPEKLQQIFKK